MEPEKKTNGALAGSIIIVVILIIGGIYVWQSKAEQTPIQSETITTEDSSSLETLEADLETADTSTGVDADTVY